jgi:hypothetical protein
MPAQKSTAKKIPKDGWVQELETQDPLPRRVVRWEQLRLAIVAYNLREFLN